MGRSGHQPSGARSSAQRETPTCSLKTFKILAYQMQQGATLKRRHRRILLFATLILVVILGFVVSMSRLSTSQRRRVSPMTDEGTYVSTRETPVNRLVQLFSPRCRPEGSLSLFRSDASALDDRMASDLTPCQSSLATSGKMTTVGGDTDRR